MKKILFLAFIIGSSIQAMDYECKTINSLGHEDVDYLYSQHTPENIFANAQDLFSQRKYAEAIPLYKKALTKLEASQTNQLVLKNDINYKLGLSYTFLADKCKQRNYKRAIAYYKDAKLYLLKALALRLADTTFPTIAPNFKQAHEELNAWNNFYLGKVLLQLEEFKESARYFEHAFNHFPQDHLFYREYIIQAQNGKATAQFMQENQDIVIHSNKRKSNNNLEETPVIRKKQKIHFD